MTTAEPIVLIAGNDVVAGAGGHPSYVRAHGWAARRAGFAPHLFSLSRTDGTLETEYGTVHQVGVRVGLERWPILSHRKNQLVWRYAFLARAVAAFVRAHGGIRLIHSFGVFGSAGVVACRLLRRHGVDAIPILSSYDTATREVTAKARGVSGAHGGAHRLLYRLELAWVRRAVARYEADGYRGSRLVLVNYESVRRLLVASYGIGDKIRKLSYASEAAFRQEPGPTSEAWRGVAEAGPGEAPRVVAVSRHDPRKGVDVLLRALARLRDRGVRFQACLVGGGALLAQHRRLVVELDLDGIVSVTGPVPDPQPYLMGADVFVLPSLEEGSGSLSLLEALQARVAVVASGIDGIPEDVTDGDTAVLVPPGDPVALADGVERLLKDDALREGIAYRGRRVFEIRFSADAFSAALRRTYAEVGVGVAP
jgi:glycosyltransferase involved in cell wall biosynthesis